MLHRFLSSLRSHTHPSRAVALVAALALAALAPRVYAQLRLAVVDVQRAAVESEQGRRAKNQLKGLFEQRQTELNNRQQNLKKMLEDIKRDRNSADRAGLQKRMEDYQKQFVEWQQNYLDFQQEISQREAEMLKQINTNMQNVLRQLGQQEHFDAVFDQSGVVWAPQNLDRTDQVIQMYNRAYPPRDEPAAGQARPAGAVTGPLPGKVLPRPLANPHPRGENTPTTR